MPDRQPIRVPLLCLAAFLAASLLVADPLREGIAHWEAGRKEQAVEVLKKAFREDPTSIDACTYLGLAAASVGDHELAVVMFDNALRLDPTLGPVRMELAQSYFALGLYIMSEAELRQVLAQGVPEGKVRQNIEGFLAAIAEKRQEGDYLFLQSYMVRLEAVRDSNARVSPTGSVYFDTGISGGVPLDVPVERDGYLAFWGSGSFEYRQRDARLGWQAQLDLGNMAYLDQQDLDLQILGAQLGPALRLSQNTAVGAMLKGLYMDKDYQDYLRGWGGRVWGTWRSPWRTNFRLEAELTDRDFTQSADNGSDGTYGSIRLQPTTLLGANLLSSSLSYAFANTTDAAESYDRFAADLRLRRPLVRRWQLQGEVSAAVRKTLYDSPGPYSTSRRRDTEYVLGCALERVFRTSFLQLETWRVGVFYEYSKSLSNLDLYTYDRHLTGVRATVAF